MIRELGQYDAKGLAIEIAQGMDAGKAVGLAIK